MVKGERAETFHLNLVESLTKLKLDGFIEEEDGKFLLTQRGREKADIPYQEIHRRKQVFNEIIASTTVSMVTLVILFVLAALKIPAG